MSRTFEISGLHVWKYRKNENYPGFNFFITQDSATQLLEALNAYKRRRNDGESLILKAPPVSKKTLLGVASDTDILTFLKIRVSLCNSIEFKAADSSLEISLDEPSFDTLCDAIRTNQEGVGDFDILDSQVWFWR